MKLAFFLQQRSLLCFGHFHYNVVIIDIFHLNIAYRFLFFDVPGHGNYRETETDRIHRLFTGVQQHDMWSTWYQRAFECNSDTAGSGSGRLENEIFEVRAVISL